MKKNERSKTANRHRRDRLSFIRRDSQSKFARHKNRLLGNGGTFVYEAYKYFGLRVEISKKLKPHGWQVLPKRLIVEQIFSWLNHSRRLSKDYELTIASAETLIKISHIHTLLNRL